MYISINWYKGWEGNRGLMYLYILYFLKKKEVEVTVLTERERILRRSMIHLDTTVKVREFRFGCRDFSLYVVR